MMEKLKEHLSKDVENNERINGGGLVPVLPVLEPDGMSAVVLQFDGYAINLFESGEWEFVDTTADVSAGK